jgi:putative peptidoglycan lipid II flippase
LPELLSAAGGNLLIGATVLVDQSIAATLVPGSVAVLGYSTRVTGVLLGIGGYALATALLPHISALVSSGQFGKLRSLLRSYAALTLAVTVPITVLLISASDAITKLLFERGSFVAEDSSLVADVQAAYALQIPFFSLGIIAVRLISAMQANVLLLLVSGLSLVLDVVFAWTLSQFFGVKGIALASSLVYTVACVLAWTLALSRLRKLRAAAAA